ncbi:hypothetical protein J7T55_003377 [Diaporthe amygdali]|uniref:uncharacterized protein n=1 Tax=Phomopsis amygdali TaxID=1214568 RepID=UPI0022FE9156|nr:uncharacterized protein J7T55_003377 [Diaporthe amygdali]KAJ0116963.1 hypothetical protein J7T55_003377 [Diaporthe amygdali]
MAKTSAETSHLERTISQPLNGAQSSEDEPTSIYRVGWRTLMAIVALSMANACAAIANTTNTIIRFQVMSLGDAKNASWIANANFLMTLAFGPVLGSLSDRFGKRWFIIVATVFGVVGSCISGSAQKTTVVIGGNILTGLANAGCIMGTPSAQEVTPNRLRPWTMGFGQCLASIAVIGGTIGAGAFVKFHTWRWSYYLNAIFYVLKIDYVGILIFTGSLASIIIGVTWGGTTYAWDSPQCLATLIIGCIGLGLFGIWEGFVVSEGILDHRLFQSRNFPILIFVCVIDGMLLLGVNVLFSQEIPTLFTVDPVQISVILTPYLATSAFGCIPAGALMARTKSYRVMLVAALLWCALFTGKPLRVVVLEHSQPLTKSTPGLMAMLNPSRQGWAYAFSAMFGIGTAVTTVIPIVALALSVPSFLLGTAGTFSVSCRALGGIIGITIFTAIYNNKMAVRLPADVGAVLGRAGQSALLPDTLGALQLGDPSALQHVAGLPASLIPSILDAQTDANVYSWKYVWIAITAIVTANAIAACFLESVAGRMNNHIESALEESEAREKQKGAVL